ncbi:hypothetical protein RFI_03289 [Reticulomyxa filosa]|uniref:Uncharacterized protein n=1 Tax=Reticulomyxa filosa TaxID=46433 RepID=X6P6S1_RETFI|nr:hypothetical protein RFI_03289 [Reticulomyxa filosa]|eukprot:ETO33813.1 hypothetical protein RFI_03289 [Reticulomyxa filosa]
MTTPKQMIDYMLGLLPDKSTSDKQRLQIFDKFSQLITSTDSPLSIEDAQYAITQFKTPMPTLVLLKMASSETHEKVFGLIVAMAKHHSNEFNTYAIFYIKKLMSHLTDKHIQSVSSCENAIFLIINTSVDHSFVRVVNDLCVEEKWV